MSNTAVETSIPLPWVQKGFVTTYIDATVREAVNRDGRRRMLEVDGLNGGRSSDDGGDDILFHDTHYQDAASAFHAAVDGVSSSSSRLHAASSALPSDTAPSSEQRCEADIETAVEHALRGVVPLLPNPVLLALIWAVSINAMTASIAVGLTTLPWNEAAGIRGAVVMFALKFMGEGRSRFDPPSINPAQRPASMLASLNLHHGHCTSMLENYAPCLSFRLALSFRLQPSSPGINTLACSSSCGSAWVMSAPTQPQA